MRAATALKSGALIGLWALCGPGRTFATEVQIVVYDSAGVGSKTLSVAETLAGKILLTAGLDSEWRAGPLSDLQQLGTDFTARTAAECAGAPSPDFWRVRVIAHAPPGLSAEALGFSLPCAAAGFQVTVFADRVAKVSEATAPTFSRVLGYAMAHELGHVLLQSAKHEEVGLMKGVWSKADWQRAAVSIIPFSPSQSRQIAGTIQRTRNTERARLHGPASGV